ncbi:hypothetical protein ABHV46_15205 [Asaia sp. BMEF1]|uniref:hypothetical protein n=1 Tax=Asaia sp. BMEF1 TaxID=3155932 RepID=UPI003F67DBF2
MTQYQPRPITASKATLADVQSVIARELGLSSLLHLLRHLEASTASRSRIARKGSVPSADLSTLRLHCGNDIESPLRKAGFNGDFESYTDPPYSEPVTQTENWMDHAAILTTMLKEDDVLSDVTRYE